MVINKENENLVLFTFAVYPLRISALEAKEDIHNELLACDCLLNSGYLKRNENGGIRISDKGGELLRDIYINYKDKFLDLLNKQTKNLELEDIIEILSLQEITHNEFWIIYFFKRLKRENIITDYSISDNGKCRYWFD